MPENIWRIVNYKYKILETYTATFSMLINFEFNLQVITLKNWGEGLI